jgi:hypothetical protein
MNPHWGFEDRDAVAVLGNLAGFHGLRKRLSNYFSLYLFVSFVQGQNGPTEELLQIEGTFKLFALTVLRGSRTRETIVETVRGTGYMFQFPD